MVFVKKLRFLNLFFYSKSIEKKSFVKVPKGKEVFIDHKNVALRNRQNLHFFKGVSPLFLSKNEEFLKFCFYAK